MCWRHCCSCWLSGPVIVTSLGHRRVRALNTGRVKHEAAGALDDVCYVVLTLDEEGAVCGVGVEAGVPVVLKTYVSNAEVWVKGGGCCSS